jgi:hypothetical protein
VEEEVVVRKGFFNAVQLQSNDSEEEVDEEEGPEESNEAA